MTPIWFRGVWMLCACLLIACTCRPAFAHSASDGVDDQELMATCAALTPNDPGYHLFHPLCAEFAGSFSQSTAWTVNDTHRAATGVLVQAQAQAQPMVRVERDTEVSSSPDACRSMTGCDVVQMQLECYAKDMAKSPPTQEQVDACDAYLSSRPIYAVTLRVLLKEAAPVPEVLKVVIQRNVKRLTIVGMTSHAGITSLLATFVRFDKLEHLGISATSVDLTPDMFPSPVHNITSLSVDKGQVQNITPDVFAALKQLKILSMENVGLISMPPNLFRSQTQLLTLHLGHNALTTLPPNLFPDQNTLHFLFLQENRLFSLSNSSFAGLTALRTLDLHNNLLTDLPPNLVSNSPLLEYLDLHSNKLDTISPITFAGAYSLATLHLSYNRLTQVSPTLVANLPKLYDISLASNRLSELPPTLFHSSQALEVVDLSDNLLRELECSLFQTNVALTEVYLQANRLFELCANLFHNTPNLRVIDLSNNVLNGLHPSLFAQSPRLQIAKFSDNGMMEELRPELFSGQGELQELMLDGNNFTYVPDQAFVGMHALERLSLANNRLRRFHTEAASPEYSRLEASVFEPLTNLLQLHLENNLLQLLDPNQFKTNTQLRLLALHNNHITNLDSELFKPLTQLEQLSLSRNKLTDLTTMDTMTSLKQLSVSFNDLETLPWLPNGIEHLDVAQNPRLVLTSLELANLTRLRASNIGNASALELNIESAKVLHVGFPGMNEETLPVSRLCSFLSADAERLEISPSAYSTVTLGCNVGAFSLTNNHNLTTMALVGRVKYLYLNGNKNLHFLIHPGNPTDLDISFTDIPYRSRFCELIGTDRFRAAGMSHPTWKTEAIDALARCYRFGLSYIDLSHNDQLGDVALLDSVLNISVAISSHRMTNLIERDSQESVPFSIPSAPMLQFLGLHLACTTDVRMSTLLNDDGFIEGEYLLLTWHCACDANAVANSDGHCEQLETNGGVAMRIVLPVFAGIIVLFMGYEWLRFILRRR
eukprot:m.363130 g.363130  ORF g.363130 m.363130 type:complete len:994 (+) comp21519_c0_seq1:37-3018(+)